MPDTNDDAIRIELDLDWSAEHVDPGTPYEDEPTETVRPGWWVRGFTSAGNPEVEIHLASGPVYDVNDDDVSDEFAELLVDLIEQATSPDPDVVLRMTPDVARRVHDVLQFGYRTARDDGDLGDDESPGSYRADIVGVLADLDGQLKADAEEVSGE